MEGEAAAALERAPRAAPLPRRALAAASGTQDPTKSTKLRVQRLTASRTSADVPKWTRGESGQRDRAVLISTWLPLCRGCVFLLLIVETDNNC